MPAIATTDDVQRLHEEGARLLEVLPQTAFELEHLPGARNIPLPELGPDSVASFDRDRPIVAYCYDHECDLSSRAAALLEQYGFSDVYDYADSKTAWLGAGLPAEGTLHERRAGDVAVRSVATCEPDAELGSLDPEAAIVIIVDDRNVVLGAVRPANAHGLPRVTALEAADTGPATVRPSITVSELARSMDDDGQHHVLVTTSAGELIGIVWRDDLPKAS